MEHSVFPLFLSQSCPPHSPKLSASHLITSKLSENTSLCGREGTLFVAITLFFTPPLLLETASCLPFSFPYIVHDSAQMPSHQRRLPGPALVKRHAFHSLLPSLTHFSFNTTSIATWYILPYPSVYGLSLRCQESRSFAWLAAASTGPTAVLGSANASWINEACSVSSPSLSRSLEDPLRWGFPPGRVSYCVCAPLQALSTCSLLRHLSVITYFHVSAFLTRNLRAYM